MSELQVGEESRSGNGVSRAWLLAAAVLVLSFSVRLIGATALYVDGVARLTPLDELYHLKRIIHSAQNFPSLLEFDPDRGLGGAFCPWAPLYDLACAAVARLLGATRAGDVLALIVWIPPVVSSLLAAAATYVLARRQPAVGMAFGVAIALSFHQVRIGSIGSIDHHFLEPYLVLAILGATILCLQTRSPRQAVVHGLALGCALASAVMMQTALLPAAGLSFVAIFLLAPEGAARAAASAGFALAAMPVAAYRLTRPPGYPDSAWYLGWPHFWALCAAAASLAVSWWLLRRGWSIRSSLTLALACGLLIALGPSHAAQAFLDGVSFFKGTPRLRSTLEARALWERTTSGVLHLLVACSVGLVLVWPLAWRAWRRRDTVLGSVALFTVLYLLASFATVRLLSISIPLLALAGALYAGTLWSRRRVAAALLLLLVALIPAVQLIQLRGEVYDGKVIQWFAPWYSVAGFLRSYAPGERILAPWSVGHLLDVMGGMKVVIDNFGFGTASEGGTFELAHRAMLTSRDGEMARFCRTNDIRFVAVDAPEHLALSAPMAGMSVARYMDGEGNLTALTRSTWWYHAYTTPRKTIPDFRLVCEGPGVRVWELLEE